jgi:Holliday junction resolvase RusA-like endonuclease
MRLIIPGEPTAKQRPRHGKFGTYTPEQTINYETLVRQLYIQQNFARQLEGQLKLKVNAYFAIPKSAPKKAREAMILGILRPVKKPDWDNVGKIISDALNKLAYHDDSQIVSASVEKWYSENPRIEVELEEIK